MAAKRGIDWPDRGRLLLVALLVSSVLFCMTVAADHFGFIRWVPFGYAAALGLGFWAYDLFKLSALRNPRRRLVHAACGVVPWILLWGVFHAGWIPLPQKAGDMWFLVVVTLFVAALASEIVLAPRPLEEFLETLKWLAGR